MDFVSYFDSDFIDPIKIIQFVDEISDKCCQTRIDNSTTKEYNFLAVLLVDGANMEYKGRATDIHSFEDKIHREFMHTNHFGDWQEYKIVKIFRGEKEVLNGSWRGEW